MSGGQKINDHKWWGGAGSNGSVFPMGAKTKNESSAEGDGELGEYWDTTEKIKQQQMMGVAKASGHRMKPGNRN